MIKDIFDIMEENGLIDLSFVDGKEKPKEKPANPFISKQKKNEEPEEEPEEPEEEPEDSEEPEEPEYKEDIE